MNTFKPMVKKSLTPPATAFLALSIVSHANLHAEDGLLLRDYFAGKVMAQIQEQCPKGHRDGWDGMAAMAYSYADAMIRVRVLKLREGI